MTGFSRALVRADDRAVKYYEHFESLKQQRGAITAAAGGAVASGAVRSVVSLPQPVDDDELDRLLIEHFSATAAATTTTTATATATAATHTAAGSIADANVRHGPFRRSHESNRYRSRIENLSSTDSVVPAIPFDPKHCPAATIGNGVEVRASKLGPNANLGLFATRRFETGDLVTEYDGCVIDEREAKARQEKKISTHIRSLGPKHASIDGRDVPNETWRGGASFANDSFGRPPYNAKWEQQRPGKHTVGVNRSGTNVFERVFLRATKQIVPGDEIYVDYGKDFWELYPISK